MRIDESLQDIKTQTGINLNIIPLANLKFEGIMENTPKSTVYKGVMDYNRVAIKVYKKTEGREELIEKEILTKANAMMKVHYSDYLVQLRGIVLEKSCYAMVMEHFYKPGGLSDLSEIIKRSSSTMDWLDRYNKAWQIAVALKHLHQCGIFHGNLNSNNVLEAANGYSPFVNKLINFGWPSLQKINDENPGKEADIYSLGTVLTELATAKIVPPQYQIIISECLDKNPAKRPQADEVAKRLYQLLKDEEQRLFGKTQAIDFKLPSEEKTEFPSPKKSLESVTAEYQYGICTYLSDHGVKSHQAETTSVGAQSTSQRTFGETQAIDFKLPSEEKTEFPAPQESLKSVIAEYENNICTYVSYHGVKSPQAETTSVGAQSTSQPQTILKSKVVNTFSFFTPEDLEAYKKVSNYCKTQAQTAAK